MAKVRLVLVKPVIRIQNARKKKVAREYDYELKGDVLTGVYAYAQKLRERYGYVTKIEVVRAKTNGKTRELVRFKDNRENAIPLYVDVANGNVYVPEAYLRKYPARFIHACVQMWVCGSGIYNVRTKVIGEVRE